MQLAKQLSRDAAREKAVTVKAELAKAPNWEAVAQAQGLYSRAVSRVARPTDGKASGGISLALQQAIFEKAVGEVAGPVTLENGDQLLALVTQSHLPTIDPTALVPTRSLAKMVDNLGRDIEARAFHSFSEGHKVDINPSLMGDAATSEE
ncbi:MAG: hypothetical protein ACOYNL_04980 [Rickettsiales bacterium]